MPNKARRARKKPRAARRQDDVSQTMRALAVTRIVLLTSVVTSVLAAGEQQRQANTGYRPKWNEQLRAEVCVERLEDNGKLNVHPATVVIGSEVALTLLGGAAACALVAPGRYQIYAHSSDPYGAGGNSDPNAWRSPTLTFDINNGERKSFERCGTSGGKRGYATWALRPAGEFHLRERKTRKGSRYRYVEGCE